MTKLVRSLINTEQTIDSIALPAWGKQFRPASTAALTAAVAAKTIQMDDVDGGESGDSTSALYAPATGATIALPNDVEFVAIDPGATIAALTLQLPAAPYDGQRVEVYFDNVVTALTMEDGVGATHTIKAALTAATAAGFATWRFSAGDSTWYRVG
jgi:hypothetical protein